MGQKRIFSFFFFPTEMYLLVAQLHRQVNRSSKDAKLQPGAYLAFWVNLSPHVFDRTAKLHALLTDPQFKLRSIL